jgi:Holliday junction DNA helicase RuvB
MARKRHIESPAEGEAALGRAGQEGPLSPAAGDQERHVENLLRPQTFDEYVGQARVTDNLKVFVESARRREDVLDHVLFCGPPGLGKTTLAHIIANSMSAELHSTSGPAIDHKGVLAGMLTNLSEGDVLFIDEIHRMVPVVEESLYPAMEDYKIEVFIGDGPHAQSVTLSLPKFTLVGATTRTGLLTSPMRDRFGVVCRLDYYDTEELAEIVRRSAARLGVSIDDSGSAEIGRRARGTPRIANRLLRRVWDFAVVEGDGSIDREMARYALSRLDVDSEGLDSLDRRLLEAVITRFDGGPVGIDSVAAAVSEERHTLEEVVEPFLIQQGFLHRTPRGRVATRKSFKHLGLEPAGAGGDGDGQRRLF